MKSVKVSVLIPVYNTSETLARALDSVINQTMKEIEIICVDDGSDEATKEVLREYEKKDERVKVFSLPENRGTLYVRKKLIEMASGDYLMFLDSDDVFYPQACEKAFSIACESMSDIVQFGVEIDFEENVSEAQKRGVAEYYTVIEERLEGIEIFERHFWTHWNLWNKIFACDVLKKALPFLPESRCCMVEDRLIYFIAAYYANSVSGIETPLIKYNFGKGISMAGIENGGFSRRFFETQCERKVADDALAEFLFYVRADSYFWTIYQRCIEDSREIIIRNFVERGSEKESRDIFQLILSVYGNAWLMEGVACFYGKELGCRIFEDPHNALYRYKMRQDTGVRSSNINSVCDQRSFLKRALLFWEDRGTFAFIRKFLAHIYKKCRKSKKAVYEKQVQRVQDNVVKKENIIKKAARFWVDRGTFALMRRSLLYIYRKLHRKKNVLSNVYDRRGNSILSRQQSEFTQRQILAQIKSFPTCPLLSVVMPIYNAPVKWLKKAVRSLKKQYYSNWQLCAVDDGSSDERGGKYLRKQSERDSRILFRRKEKNSGISDTSNVAISLAKGDYIALMDQDDAVTPDALFWMAKEILAHPEAALIYSDECKIGCDGGEKTSEFYIKPDWSPELLISQMYIGHLSVYKKQFVEDIGGFRSEFDLCQDFDLALRTLTVCAEVRHVRRILYLWRKVPGSGSVSGKNKALNIGIGCVRSFGKTIDSGANAYWIQDSYRLKFSQTKQKISIIIPSDNESAILKCIDKIAAMTDYPFYQIVIVTKSDKIQALQSEKFAAEVRFCAYDKPFNFSDKCNEGARAADGDIVVFYNDDVYPLRPDWLKILADTLRLPGVGGVSPALLNKDRMTIQYAGMISGTPLLCGTPFDGFNFYEIEGNPFYHTLMRDVSVLSGACCAFDRNLFLQTLFNAQNTPNGNSDVELSFKLIEKGYRCVYNPLALGMHLGNRSWEPKKTVDKSDIYMLKNWGKYLEEDMYFPDGLKELMYETFRLKYKIYGIDRLDKKTDKDILFVVKDLDCRSDSAELLLVSVREALRQDHFPVVTSPKDGELRKTFQQMGVTVIVDECMVDDGRFWIFYRFAKNFDLVCVLGEDGKKIVGGLDGNLCRVIWFSTKDHGVSGTFTGGNIRAASDPNEIVRCFAECGGADRLNKKADD